MKDILTNEIEKADAIIVGIGAGMSTASGFSYSGERFERYFSDFQRKYGITDIYSGGFYPFGSLEEYWAWWSRTIYYNRYNVEVGKPYYKLLNMIKDKNYFVITTNVDHQLQLAGFDKDKLFYMQGDFGLFQCSKPCHNKTYDNKEIIERMIEEQKDMRIPSNLIPLCPKCKEPMTMNLRIDDRFVEDDGLQRQREKYIEFVNKYKDKKVLYLELGVGDNTPVIIHYPFISLTLRNDKARLIVINKDKVMLPKEISNQTIEIIDDISNVL